MSLPLRLRPRGLLVLCAAAMLGPAPAADASQGSADYTVSATSGLYETPPATATTLTFSAISQSTKVTSPFAFAYWGVWYTDVHVAPEGFVQIGVSSGRGDIYNANLASVGAGVAQDGICSPLWDADFSQYVRVWTAGTAPNRRFIVSWDDAANSYGGHLWFQVKFLEGSGVVQFAYRPDTTPSTWVGLLYNSGLVAPGTDPRWIATTTDTPFQQTRPAADYEFTPRRVHTTGRLRYDRFVPTAQGIPSAPLAGQALAGTRVELRYSSGGLNASATTAADGTFDVAAFAGPPSTSLDLHAVAASAAGSVSGSAGSSPVSLQVAGGIGFAADTDAGTLDVTAANDADGTFRESANIAAAIQRASAWAAPLTTDPIPPIAVVYDHASAAATRCTSGSSPSLRVAGPGSPNPDAWDDAIVIKAYARHLLASIAASPTAAYDGRFDAVTSEQDAFAEGFGCYVAAVVTASRHLLDGTGPSSATDIDLEDPKPVTASGPAVAAWVAAALYDLADAANEAHDLVDGTADQAAAFRVVDSLSVPVTAEQFDAAWASRADAFALSRDFIHHGLTPDDAFEPNDFASEPAAFGPAGTRRGGLVLGRHNEDWFSVDVASPVSGLVVDVSYPWSTYPAGVRLDVYGPGGTLLVSRTAGASGLAVADAGPVGPGTCKVRVRHVSGAAIGAYSLQAADRLAMGGGSLKSWTVGRPYDDALALSGGVRPYVFSVQPSAAAVPGLLIDATNLRVTGTPTQPGTYAFTLSAQDSGSPARTASSSNVVVIADPLDFPMAEFLGVPFGRPAGLALPRRGGTAPFSFSVAAGDLPAGVTLDAATARLTGTATVPGASALTFHGIDVAGSEHAQDVTAVVCVPFAGRATPADLAAGGSACGFFADAVAGSTLTFGATTAKGAAKRTLRAAVVGPGAADVPGAVLKGGRGRASASKVVAPSSGRFCFVAAADDGDATHLLGSFSVKPPAAGKAASAGLSGGETFDVQVGALAGAALKFTAKPDAKSGLTLTIVALLGPDGSATPLTGLVGSKKKAVTLAATLPASGTWTVRVRADGDTQGTASSSFTIRQPKGAEYVAE